ncbi:MAG: FAD-dependent monooxygenase [Bacteroidetes bacterium]|nr:FAD-dependent monooxygenase [Bacteroidota bacterium]
MKKIGIVGAGLVGSLQAILMARKGYKVEVFERRPDLREVEMIGGRSINLALSDRGWKALELAGVDQKIREIALPMFQRCMHDKQGNLSYQPYGVNNESIFSVSRGRLNQILMNEAKHYDNVDYHFNLKTKDVDLRDNTLVMQNLDKDIITYEFDKLFACDGAFSAVRSRLQRSAQFNYAQQYLTHGYKELEIPANLDGTHRLQNDCLHIWPRGEFMMIALPNLNGSFTCTLFFPMQGKLSFDSLNTAEKLMVFFQDYFPDTIELIPDLKADFFDNPVGSLVTVKCDPWQVNDDVLLMGDAAHAIVPFYGQGMNAGFEDCTVFSKMYEQANGNWEGLMKSFSDTRFKDGHAIADLALYNYIEMRDKTADPDFLLRKKIEAKFTRLHPDKWMPLYSLVTFSHTPYHEALANGLKQRALMDEVMKDPTIHDNWDDEVTMTKILRLLEKEKNHV